MRPVPSSWLLALLLALCGLCAWQWTRESALRQITRSQAATLTALQTEQADLAARVEAANAEILRLTGTLQELRTTSVARIEHEESQQRLTQLTEVLQQQQTALEQRQEGLTTANAAIRQANATVEKLTAERNELARRLNDLTAKYNAAVKERPKN